jgi:hypothetical protein
LDEMVVKIRGQRLWPWRAVDDEGEVLDFLVEKRRNKNAALKLLRKLLRNHAVRPYAIVTDKLASYRAAAEVPGLANRRRPGEMRANNRAENSHRGVVSPNHGRQWVWARMSVGALRRRRLRRAGRTRPGAPFGVPTLSGRVSGGHPRPRIFPTDRGPRSCPLSDRSQRMQRGLNL